MTKQLEDMSLEELWQLFPIVLEEHSQHYKSWYEEERNRILGALKGFEICRINHIGSTAVEGLIAKPIVDILLELSPAYDIASAVQALQNDNWIVMTQDDTKKTIDLNKGYTPQGFAEKVYHLHVRPSGDWDELYFRDYLQQHPETAQVYAELKFSLKEQFEHNRDAYTKAKSDFVKTQTKKARREFGGFYAL